MRIQKIESFNAKLESLFRLTGNVLVNTFHYLALFTIWGCDCLVIPAGLILLLFIYLEPGAMVGIYFKTNRMPVRFLVYVGITALTRVLPGDIQAHHNNPDEGLLIISGGILLPALANLIIRFGSVKYPSVRALDND